MEYETNVGKRRREAAEEAFEDLGGPGISVWDYYAAHGLAGLTSTNGTNVEYDAFIAALAADAMLEERKKRGLK